MKERDAVGEGKGGRSICVATWTAAAWRDCFGVARGQQVPGTDTCWVTAKEESRSERLEVSRRESELGPRRGKG